MKTAFLITITAILYWAGSAQSNAQSPTAPDPSIAPVPETTNWEITISQSGEADPHYPTKIVVTKTPKYRKDEIFFASGMSTEIWTVDGKTVTKYLSGEFAVDPAGTEATANEWVTESYFGTEWIRPVHFAGTKRIDDVEAHYYAKKASAPPQAGASGAPRNDPPAGENTARSEETSFNAEAWVDPSTMRPIRVIIEQTRFDYRFDLEPDEAFSVPPHVRRSLTAWQKLRGL